MLATMPAKVVSRLLALVKATKAEEATVASKALEGTTAQGRTAMDRKVPSQVVAVVTMARPESEATANLEERAATASLVVEAA